MNLTPKEINILYLSGNKLGALDVNMNPKKVVKDLVALYDEVELLIARIALEKEIDVSLGEYGHGRTLLLKHNCDENGEHWSGYKVGEWLPSSATC